jgi:hypothetical protein
MFGLRRTRQPTAADEAAERQARAMGKPPPPPPGSGPAAFLNPVGVNAETPTVAGYDRNTKVSLPITMATT